MSKAIIVSGATGRQGGAVIKALSNTDFEVLALTRNTSSPSAAKLASSAPNIKLLQGDLDDCTALFKKAKEVTKNPIWGVYSVQAKPTGPVEDEVTQGTNLIDAAIANNVQYFVYSSADRGVNSDTDPTPVPHWATKYRVEKYLEQKAKETNMRYTVLRPTAFMENISNDFAGKAMASSWQGALPKTKPLQLVATRDIGWFGAQAFKNPDEFAGQYISIAGAELTFNEANEVFRSKFNKDMPTTLGLVAAALLHVVKDLGLMFKFLKENGTSADVDACRRMHPQLMDFGTWLETESQFRPS